MVREVDFYRCRRNCILLKGSSLVGTRFFCRITLGVFAQAARAPRRRRSMVVSRSKIPDRGAKILMIPGEHGKDDAMAVARIGEVQAKPELTENLRDFLVSIMPGIRGSAGCESVHLYQNEEDPS